SLLGVSCSDKKTTDPTSNSGGGNTTKNITVDSIREALQKLGQVDINASDKADFSAGTYNDQQSTFTVEIGNNTAKGNINTLNQNIENLDFTVATQKGIAIDDMLSVKFEAVASDNTSASALLTLKALQGYKLPSGVTEVKVVITLKSSNDANNAWE
uniref:hypothetical protein n=2 Tax=uncultured Brachyspira sp. TaxID=221953 RepID=UPI00261D2F53